MIEKILIADDSRINRSLLRGILSREGYHTVEASDGDEAITAAREEMPALILLDVEMPKHDGFEVCEALKGQGSTQDVPIIFLSSLDEAEYKIRGLDLGASDYVAKPYNRDEVLARVRTQLRIRRLTRTLQEANRVLVEQRRQIEGDREAAAEIQRSLLPDTSSEGRPLGIAHRYEPCGSVGGDIFNVHPLTGNETALYMADVTGHGVASALVTISVSQWLSPHNLVETSADGAVSTLAPADVLRRVNREYPAERFDLLFTMSYLLLDSDSGLLRYSSAGHPPPLVLRAGGDVQRLSRGGTLIGLGDFLDFEEGSVLLEPGDRVLLYTDGIHEAPLSNGELFGLERLEAFLGGTQGLSLDETCSQLLEVVSNGGADASTHDDVSLLLFEYDPRDS